MPTCLVVQHVEPEYPYAIGQALASAGVEVVLCRVYASDPLPQHMEDFDGFVVMGGPMSATSDESFATRRQEIALLVEAIDLGVPTLGVCLGAQLLAVAAGSRVVSSPVGPEIGWGPIRLTAEAVIDPLFSLLPDELTVLHWHGETYELPPGAVHLASSAMNLQQAFRVGDRAWGLQFHLEVDATAVGVFASAFEDEALSAGTTPEAILAATPTALTELLPHRHALLMRFAHLVTHVAAPRT